MSLTHSDAGRPRNPQEPAAIQRRSDMKTSLWKAILVAAVGLSVLSGTAWADGNGCSNATLKGQYAFGVTAYTPPGLPNGPPQVVAGIKIFDGNGHFTQRDYPGDGLRAMPPQTDFAMGETGTYTVNSNCTGSMVINLNQPGVPAGLSTGVIKIMFVISNGGRHIHEVVSEFTPPFSSGPVPTQASADDWKVASDEDN